MAKALTPALGFAPEDGALGPIDLDLARYAHFRHRVAPLLHHAVATCGISAEEDAARFLERQAARNARRVLQQKAAVRRFGDALDRAGIGWLEVKGWHLGDSLYPAASLRHAKDVDLLIEPGRAEDAITLAAKLGYRGSQGGGNGETLDVEHSRQVLRYHRETSIFDPASGAEIEIHAHLLSDAPPGWRDPPTSSSKEERSQTLRRPDYVLYLITHGTATGWKRMKWLCDLALLASGVDCATRKQAIALARELDGLPALCASFDLLRELWPQATDGLWLPLIAPDECDAKTIRSHRAAFIRQLNEESEPSAPLRYARHLGLLRDPPVFGTRHPSFWRQLRRTFALRQLWRG
ncbi:nucleotidyltransferase family protein [Aurantiacibacter spongiae]|uniref:nucleotidyltransferase family protein n=1 Tax=Aurantiacibacter spongiae TaxID=2488860 RepID=UPI001315133D|nr:nucleotidyltransferase family protein [Aurantiacibacter spongiae]